MSTDDNVMQGENEEKILIKQLQERTKLLEEQVEMFQDRIKLLEDQMKSV